MKKNVAALVLGIIGAVFGLIGGILWAACAGAEADAGNTFGSGAATSEGTIYLVVYIVLGIGGAVLSLIGSIQAFNLKWKPGLILSVLGLLFEIGVLIASCVHVGGFSFLLELCVLVAIVLLFVEVIMAARKPKADNNNNGNINNSNNG